MASPFLYPPDYLVSFTGTVLKNEWQKGIKVNILGAIHVVLKSSCDFVNHSELLDSGPEILCNGVFPQHISSINVS